MKHSLRVRLIFAFYLLLSLGMLGEVIEEFFNGSFIEYIDPVKLMSEHLNYICHMKKKNRVILHASKIRSYTSTSYGKQIGLDRGKLYLSIYS
jgi:hypothetical protein